MVFFKIISFYKVITVYLMQQMCMYLTLQQSMKLLTVEYQKGHTSYEERAHFLVFIKWGGGQRAQAVHPLFRSLREK